MGKYERLARLVKIMALLRTQRQSLNCVIMGRENRRDIESSDRLGTKPCSVNR